MQGQGVCRLLPRLRHAVSSAHPPSPTVPRAARRGLVWTSAATRRRFSVAAAADTTTETMNQARADRRGRKRKTPPTSDPEGSGEGGTTKVKAVAIDYQMDLTDDNIVGYGGVAEKIDEENEVDLVSHVYSWGAGTHGALGHGYYNDQHIPKKLKFFKDYGIKQVSAGWAHTVLVDRKGRIWKWGWIDDVKTIFSSVTFRDNAPDVFRRLQAFGKLLGVGWPLWDNGTLLPEQVEELDGIPIRKAHAGAGCTIALAEDGRVFTWGHGRWGQLGHPIFVTWTEVFTKPKPIERLKNTNIVDMASGYVHSLFLDDTGQVWVCGPGLNGRLGLGLGAKQGEFAIPRALNPVWEQRLQAINRKREHRARRRGREVDLLDYIPRVVKVACGNKHSVLLTDDGKVWTFGAGMLGALGHGHDFTDKYWPTVVEGIADKRVIDIKCGQHHTICLTEDKEVWTWGMSRHGQTARHRHEGFMLRDFAELGEDLSVVEESPPAEHEHDMIVGNDPLACPPGPIYWPDSHKYEIRSISGGWYETSIITKCGRVFTWGDEFGKLVENPTSDETFIEPGIVTLAHGWLHTIAVTRH